MYQYFIKIVPTVYKNISGSVRTHTHRHTHTSSLPKGASRRSQTLSWLCVFSCTGRVWERTCRALFSMRYVAVGQSGRQHSVLVDHVTII